MATAHSLRRESYECSFLFGDYEPLLTESTEDIRASHLSNEDSSCQIEPIECEQNISTSEEDEYEYGVYSGVSGLDIEWSPVKSTVNPRLVLPQESTSDEVKRFYHSMSVCCDVFNGLVRHSERTCDLPSRSTLSVPVESVHEEDGARFEAAPCILNEHKEKADECEDVYYDEPIEEGSVVQQRLPKKRKLFATADEQPQRAASAPAEHVLFLADGCIAFTEYDADAQRVVNLRAQITSCTMDGDDVVRGIDEHESLDVVRGVLTDGVRASAASAAGTAGTAGAASAASANASSAVASANTANGRGFRLLSNEYGENSSGEKLECVDDRILSRLSNSEERQAYVDSVEKRRREQMRAGIAEHRAIIRMMLDKKLFGPEEDSYIEGSGAISSNPNRPGRTYTAKTVYLDDAQNAMVEQTRSTYQSFVMCHGPRIRKKVQTDPNFVDSSRIRVNTKKYAYNLQSSKQRTQSDN